MQEKEFKAENSVRPVSLHSLGRAWEGRLLASEVCTPLVTAMDSTSASNADPVTFQDVFPEVRLPILSLLPIGGSSGLVKCSGTDSLFLPFLSSLSRCLTHLPVVSRPGPSVERFDKEVVR